MKKLHGKSLFLFLGVVMLYILFIPQNASASIVNPHQEYTYAQMERDIQRLAQTYPDLIKYEVIGKSEYGRNIYAVALGNGHSTVFINGSHHAREWLSTNLNMHMIEQYAQGYRSNRSYDNGRYPIRSILDNTTIWFVPMVNPDGVELQQKGLSAFPSSSHSGLITMNNGSLNFKRWKANAKGVDLNRQYDALWATIRNDPGRPHFENYKGTSPHSASETKAMVNFTRRIDPEIAVNYHSSGEILFWNFLQTGARYERDLRIARQISSLTSYPLIYAGSNPSGGGMTDWFINDFHRPAFTPELGRYVGPTNLPISEFNRIWVQNRYVGLYVAQESHKLYQGRAREVAEREVRSAEQEANKLVDYYVFSSPDDVALTPAFQAQYDKSNDQINHAVQIVRSLNASELKRNLQDRLNRAVELRRRATVTIRVINRGELLDRRAELLEEEFARGTVSDRVRIRRDNVLIERDRTEESIERVIGVGNRRLFTNAYVTSVNDLLRVSENAFVKDTILLQIEDELAKGNQAKVAELLRKLDELTIPNDPRIAPFVKSLNAKEAELRATVTRAEASEATDEEDSEEVTESEDTEEVQEIEETDEREEVVEVVEDETDEIEEDVTPEEFEEEIIDEDLVEDENNPELVATFNDVVKNNDLQFVLFLNGYDQLELIDITINDTIIEDIEISDEDGSYSFSYEITDEEREQLENGELMAVITLQIEDNEDIHFLELEVMVDMLTE
ncbi:M14 family metallocarboxypeptidase [Bacillus sp. LL01]|uniref:M14 family metallopeptidase n=1 Tax=Bacillus sp. LL01 TaxID=1665556 RepID=UPI0009E43B09|nr:M14 family metallocarboxypeptidase [Bacillus sp. LL01]